VLVFAGLGGGARGPANRWPGPRNWPNGSRRAARASFFPTAPLLHGTSTPTAFIGFHFGQRVVTHRGYVPEEVLRTIEKERVSSVSLVGDAMLRPRADAPAGPR